MICSNCGAENAAGQRFCDQCGAGLAVGCPQCGQANRPNARFCGTCGATLVGEGSVAATGSVSQPSAAERRFVSVLFVDLVGFTPYAEDRDPETVRETLDRYFEMARLAIERHGGTIEKFIGDAVMAVWGTPIAREDDAERAVRAALEVVDGARGLGTGIEARAGIVTGEAAVTIGAEGQGMVAGDLVNTASRLQSVAVAGTVLVGEATMHAAAAAIAFEPAGEQALKGKTAPVDAYRALRVVAQRGGQNRSEVLEAPFVGRDEELRQLKELLHATTRDGRVRLISITGPAGVGKSRLTWEFEKYVDGVVETIYWHRGRSPSYGEGITFWALGEMVRRRAQLAETDDETTTRKQIAGTVAEFIEDAEEREWVEPALLTLLGLEPAPAGGRDALFAAWRIFFERISVRATTVLVFEDLQWADSGLLDFIEYLLEWSKNHPLLVIALARSEFYERRPGFGSGHRQSTSMPLEPLPESAMRELLAGLVPGLPEQAMAAILRRADGIPLYAVETVRMLVSDNRLELVDGTYRPRTDLGELAVPESLRSLIASRLDAVDQADRSLLQDGAILGQRFTLPALAALSGLPPDQVESRLRALVRRELLDLEIDPRSPERGQYGFVQSLIREVAYGTLARRERRARHLAAARYFEGQGDDELAGALASHYLAAFETSTEGAEADTVAVQARIALRGAAERAAALGAHEQAVSYLEQALAIATDAPDRASMLELAAISANAATRQEAAEGFARQSIEIHNASGDDRAAARGSALLGRILIDRGRLPEAIAVMEDALAGREDGPDDVTATLLAILSRALMRSYQPESSIESADRALAFAEPHNLERVVAEALVNKASSLVMFGRRREARALHEAAIEIADRGGWIEVGLRARMNLTFALVNDDPKRAREAVLGGIERARRFGQRFTLNFQYGTAALFMHGIGEDWEPALDMLGETISTAPAGFDRARATAIQAIYRVSRGENSDHVDEGLEAEARREPDPQIQQTLAFADSEQALTEGRFADAYELASRAAAAWPENTAMILPTAIRAALWIGDPTMAREGARRLDDYPGGANHDEALRIWAMAGIAALEGRHDDAVRGFADAIDRLRSIGFHFSEARAIIDAVKLLPERSEVREWAPAAREILDRVKARPYLAILDQALAASAGRLTSVATPEEATSARAPAP